MSFVVYLSNGKQLPFKVQAADADVAVYRAKKLGFRNVSHAVAA